MEHTVLLDEVETRDIDGEKILLDGEIVLKLNNFDVLRDTLKESDYKFKHLRGNVDEECRTALLEKIRK